MLQWLAILSMLVDHIGIVFYPESIWWRVIGRIAFPIYAYFLIEGTRYSRNRKNYIKRLFFIALASQIPFTLLFGGRELNVVFTLLFSAAGIIAFEKRGIKWSIGIGLLLFSLTNYFDYGIYGYLLCLTYYFFRENSSKIILSHFALTFLAIFIFHWNPLQLLSIAASFIISYKSFFPKVKMNRIFYRSFYPAHLFLLYVIKTII